ncbi:MAG: nucleotide exchange factor GrpE [Desulfobacterales bacterium]
MSQKKKSQKNVQFEADESAETTAKVNPEEENEVSVDENSEEALSEQILATEKEAHENYDRFLRVSAEFENHKKRTAREMTEFRKYANETFVKEMLPVVDNLQRAIVSAKEKGAKNSGLVEGVQLTLKDMLKVFDKFRVKPIEALGEIFDPTYHQAVQQEETENHTDNTVIRELQTGYTIHDRLLRASMVIVAKSSLKKKDPKKED